MQMSCIDCALHMRDARKSAMALHVLRIARDRRNGCCLLDVGSRTTVDHSATVDGSDRRRLAWIGPGLGPTQVNTRTRRSSHAHSRAIRDTCLIRSVREPETCAAVPNTIASDRDGRCEMSVMKPSGAGRAWIPEKKGERLSTLLGHSRDSSLKVHHLVSDG